MAWLVHNAKEQLVIYLDSTINNILVNYYKILNKLLLSFIKYLYAFMLLYKYEK